METRPNIRHAIQRSQRARNAFNRRRRRTAIAVSALIVATVPASLAFLGVGTSDVARAAQGGAKGLAELLGQRSPGERTQAELTKTKKARALAKTRPHAIPASAARGPSPFLLARLLLPPAGGLPADFGKPVVTAETPTPFSFFSPPPGGGGGGVIVTPPGQTPPEGGGGVVVTPPGQSPPEDGNPPSQPTELVVTPPAVPEPGTWAMMLLGFGLMGWTVRRESLQRAVRTA